MGTATIGAFRRVNDRLGVRAVPGNVLLSTLSTPLTHVTKIGLMPKFLTAVALLDGSPAAIIFNVYQKMQHPGNGLQGGDRSRRLRNGHDPERNGRSLTSVGRRVVNRLSHLAKADRSDVLGRQSTGKLRRSNVGGKTTKNIIDRILRTILEGVEIQLSISEIGRNPGLVVNVACTDLQTLRNVFKLVISSTQSLNFLQDLEGDFHMHHQGWKELGPGRRTICLCRSGRRSRLGGRGRSRRSRRRRSQDGKRIRGRNRRRAGIEVARAGRLSGRNSSGTGTTRFKEAVGTTSMRRSGTEELAEAIVMRDKLQERGSDRHLGLVNG